MADWYYSEAEQPVGPISEEKLLRLVAVGTVGGDTLVWTEGMKDWRPAREVPILFSDRAGAGAPSPPRPRRAAPVRVESHLAKAIIVTILCCVPFGIVAIVFASQVSSKSFAGDLEGAQDSARKADQWATFAIVAGILSWLLVGVRVAVH